jgi:hypothetical protein
MELTDREKDVMTICEHIINMSVDCAGDYGMGGKCPFCKNDCSWDDELSDVIHKPDCIYLIAKKLLI